MRNVGLDEAQAGIKIARRTISNLRYADILLTESEEELRWRQWQPTPVLLPGKSHGWRSLVGCSPWDHKESDMSEWLHFHFSLSCIGGGNGNPLQCSCLENPRDEEASGLPSMGSHRVGHDWSDLAAAAEEELKSLLMKVKEKSEKVGLKLNIHKTKIMASSPITSWQIDGETVTDFILGGGLQNHCRWWLQPWNEKTLASWKKSYDQTRQHIKKQRNKFANKGPSSQGYGFSSSYAWTWELDYKESWASTNWCFWTVLLEKTLESPLDCKEIQSVHPKGNQSCIFIGRTDVEAETPILWPPDVKNWLIWKDSDAGKDWRREEKGMTEDEMVG